MRTTTIHPTRWHACCCHTSGQSLISVLLALSLGAGVMLSSIGLVQSAHARFVEQRWRQILEQDADHALALIARSLQPWADGASPGTGTLAPDIEILGLDNVMLAAGSEGLTSPLSPGVEGSDVLAVRYRQPSGAPPDALVNCAGFPVTPEVPAQPAHGWSIFHIATSAQGEPELRCKYRGAQRWESQTVVPGVESLQLLFGLDTDDDGLPNQYVNATRLKQTASASPEPWARVAAVQVVLRLVTPVIAGMPAGAGLELPASAFGTAYADQFGPLDPGARVRSRTAEDAGRAVARRLRRQVDAVFFLRRHRARAP